MVWEDCCINSYLHISINLEVRNCYWQQLRICIILELCAQVIPELSLICIYVCVCERENLHIDKGK